MGMGLIGKFGADKYCKRKWHNTTASPLPHCMHRLQPLDISSMKLFILYCEEEA
jgi:hypothetical protein